MLCLGIFRLKLRNSSDTFEISSIEFAKMESFLQNKKAWDLEKTIAIFEISTLEFVQI